MHCAAGKGRAGVQQVMQRRHQARVNILSGKIPTLAKEWWEQQEGPDKALMQTDYKVKQLLFSPDGDQVLIVTDSDLTLFKVLNAKQVWHQWSDTIIEQYKSWDAQDMTFKILSAFFGQHAITVFAWTSQDIGDGTDFFTHFISLDIASGAVKAMSAFHVNQADVMQPYSDCFFLCNHANFSQQGNVAAARLSAVVLEEESVSSDDFDESTLSDLILIMDVSGNEPKLLLDIPHSQRSSPLCVFSWDESYFLSSGKLVHLRDGATSDLADGSRLTFDDRAFDRAARHVGVTADVNGQEFAIVFSTESGREVFRTPWEGNEFVQFTASDSYAVVQQRGDYTIQIWDFVGKRELLSTEPFGTRHPTLLLDDKIILGESQIRLCENDLGQFLRYSRKDEYILMGINAQAASSFITYANWGPYVSPDGCALISAMLLANEDNDDDENGVTTEISLVRLC